MHRPLRIWDTKLADGTPALMTDGTPSDCVTLATSELVKSPIEVVVSGINPLANLGHDITYSGTVAAAIEATISGLKGFAVSLDVPSDFTGEPDFTPAAQMALRIIEKILSYPHQEGILFNINVPANGIDHVKGVKITKQGKSSYHDRVIRRQDMRGHEYYWIGGDRKTDAHDPETDSGALFEGYISVTPLQLDFTAHSNFQSIEAWSLDL
jgi:5'-nucleotidase